MEMSSGEESNDMMLHHPDIEEIDEKLTSKRKKKDVASAKPNKTRKLEQIPKSPELKITLSSVKTMEMLNTGNEKETAKGGDYEKNSNENPKKINNEEKKLKKKLTDAEKSLRKQMKEEEKRKRDEEKKIKQEQKEQKKILAEQEKQIAKEQKLEQKEQKKILAEQEKQIAKEQKLVLKEEKRKVTEEKLEEQKIAQDERKIQMEQKRMERAEKKKKLEEESALKRKEHALKGMKYLLSVSEKYSDFYKEKLSAKPVKQASGKPLQERNKFLPTVDDMKEAAKVQTRKSIVKDDSGITQYLKYFENGTLHPYQVDGVTWLKVLYDNGINGILADEMGLGKTVQVIALICHLLEKRISGPFLVIVPLSTLPNWKSEFQRFAPKIPVVVFYGNEQQRRAMYHKIHKKYVVDGFTTLPVILTSYQIPLLEHNFMQRLEYQYVIVDEGHRIKNCETKLSIALRSLNSSNRLLLTGTPLQNDITELWSLLNFLMPHLFTNMDTFASLLMLEDVHDENKLIEQEEKNNILHTLHRVLAPFMLRRLKKDVLTDLVPKKEIIVYCPMTKFQKMLYTNVIEKNLKSLQMKEGEDFYDPNIPRPKRKCVQRKIDYNDLDMPDYSDEEDIVYTEIERDVPSSIKNEVKPFIVRLTMQNTTMMFRKIVNHPYLIHFPLDPNEDQKCLLINEDLINASGKMMVLDVLLEKLKISGHKVLIFTTLVMTLDLIEEMLILRDHQYRRIDGGRNVQDRGSSIEEFNSNPDILAFLLSTRAGGLGLNLTGADTCIFFDRDWNPQADIQAEARCHRIGQTRPVMVYTLVAKNTIDEKIITLGYQKRRLEKLVIHNGKFRHLKDQDVAKTENELKELKELLDNDTDKPFEEEFSNEILDNLLDRSELYEIMKGMKK